MHRINFSNPGNEVDLYKLIFMKKTFAVWAVLISLLACSCSKQSQGELRTVPAAEPDQIINVKVGSGNTCTVNLGTAANVTILRQASHFQVSEMIMDKTDGSFTYKYLPAANFTGTDEVSLARTSAVTSDSDGCSYVGQNTGSTSTRITIKLNVTD